ncbi:MAG: hypothetical protein EXS31_03135 [Pedosphaera sp.]|nr:hypothetical protein [Pedosphaera sp.]
MGFGDGFIGGVMRILVTCGPGYEPIDEVRRITNFSSGRLGIRLSNAFAARGWEVTCFKGEQAACVEPIVSAEVRMFSTNSDLARQLEEQARTTQVDAIFHAAALCDFTIDSVLDESGRLARSAKFSTTEGRLHLVLKPAPKILPLLRSWFGKARVVGWKYELIGSVEEALSKAQRQIMECQNDACVLNGKAYGKGFGLCLPDGEVRNYLDDRDLATGLIEWLEAAPSG